MKKLLVGIGLAALVGTTILATKTQGSNTTAQRRECIIVSYQGVYGPPVQVPNGSYSPQIDLQTGWISRSSNAPIVAAGTPLAQAIADILSEGFTIEHNHSERKSQKEEGNYEMIPQISYGQIMFLK